MKQWLLLQYARKHNLHILVETGTYRGDMVEAMRTHFSRIYSIEVGADLFRDARERFRQYPHIEIIQGDSGKVLKDLMGRIIAPALFWLDGHYSGDITAMGEKETPILEKLPHILEAPDLGHVLLIDDARCFGNPEMAGYPVVTELAGFIKTRRPDAHIGIANDCIAVVTKRAE